MNVINKRTLNAVSNADIYNGRFTMPEGVTSIGTGAFQDCTNLTSIIIPEGVTQIYKSAFEGCTCLMNVTLPSSMRFISINAFKDCVALKKITIPDGITHMGRYAFRGCTGLIDVTIPGSLKTIPIGAFDGCSALKTAVISDGVYRVGGGAFRNCAVLDNVKIANTVKRIDGGAFDGCANLRNIILPCALSRIADGAFKNCIGLTGITIPESVLQIGERIFSGCTSLASITFIRGGLRDIRRCSCAGGVLAFSAFDQKKKTLESGVSFYKTKEFCGTKFYRYSGRVYGLYDIKDREKRELLMRDCFIVEQDGFTAHGDTLSDAMIDLCFKQAECQDAEQYRDMDLNTPIPLECAMSMYHNITGACRSGIEKYITCLGVRAKSKYTIKELIELSRDQKGGKEFEAFWSEKGTQTSTSTKAM